MVNVKKSVLSLFATLLVVSVVVLAVNVIQKGPSRGERQIILDIAYEKEINPVDLVAFLDSKSVAAEYILGSNRILSIHSRGESREEAFEKLDHLELIFDAALKEILPRTEADNLGYKVISNKFIASRSFDNFRPLRILLLTLIIWLGGFFSYIIIKTDLDRKNG